MKIFVTLLFFVFSLLLSTAFGNETISKNEIKMEKVFKVEALLINISSKPIISFIIQNKTGKEISFEIIPFRNNKECINQISQGNLGWPKDSFLGFSPPFGLVPGNQWAHRYLPVSLNNLKEGCVLNYKVKVGESVEEVEIKISQQATRNVDNFNGEKINLFVEGILDKPLVENSIGKRIRVRIINKSVISGEFYITNRKILCPDNEEAFWDLQTLMPPGFSFGPIQVESKKWGVFIQDIRVDENSKLHDCFAEFEISMLDPVLTFAAEKMTYSHVEKVKIPLF